MGERRKARRYQVYLPLQVCTASKRPAEFHTAHLRDISRTGVYFVSEVPVPMGAGLELTFALPGEAGQSTGVLVRASAKALRSSEFRNEIAPRYGIAATIDRIDLVRPVITNAA